MIKASIVVPAYNAAKTLPETLTSLLAQDARDFEIIVVDDGSTDDTAQVVAGYLHDPRVRLVRQANRGLAGARNSGIAASRGDYIGFCDADDIWAPVKLSSHIDHLDRSPDVGISFSGSRLIDDEGQPTGMRQSPRLKDISAACILKRNPIGNGSAPVIRRVALRDLEYRPNFETKRPWVFDETFRQSEDIECWMRFALSTDWQIEGIPGLLTGYRINHAGLSSDLDRQLSAWERMITKLRPLAPDFFATHEDAARAYQLRYLARRAVSNLDGSLAWELSARALSSSHRPLCEEPVKTLVTLAAAFVLHVAGPFPVQGVSRVMTRLASRQYKGI
ncbi:MAG: glycosyltransferase family A protein [Litoreibacter sp.]|uniref:glycosyltransferase family 2 protein n=1 Tax=Litoreibacter sp. TaxID=1969459 RepID=UPI003296DB13